MLPLEDPGTPIGYIFRKREEQDPDLRRSWVLSCLWTSVRAAHHFGLHQITENCPATVHYIVEDAVYLSLRSPHIRSRPGC